MALAMGGITGVTAMKKEELIAAIREAKGLPVKETRVKPLTPCWRSSAGSGSSG